MESIFRKKSRPRIISQEHGPMNTWHVWFLMCAVRLNSGSTISCNRTHPFEWNSPARVVNI